MVDATQFISEGRQSRGVNDLSAARAYYVEAARVYRDQNNLLAYAHTIRHIADMHLEESNYAEAKPLYEESLELYRSNPNTKLLDLANAIRPYALLNEKLGNFDLARQLWHEAKNLYSSLRIEAGVSECDVHLFRKDYSG